MRVLVCVASALFANACYSPNLADCQFKCGAGNSCPDGTSCTNGFCRTSTGACHQMDAPGTGIDVSLNCPPNGPSSCSGTPKQLTTGCAVLCDNQVSPAQAGVSCPPNTAPTGMTGWHLAVVMTGTKRMEFASRLGGEVGWIGLHKDLDGWHWQDPNRDFLSDTDPSWAGGMAGGGSQDVFGLLDANAGPPNLRNSNAGDQQKFFCEYTP